MRALLAAMNAWVKDNTAPPPSVYPKLADHALVKPAEVHFPKLSGVAFPLHPNAAYRLDFSVLPPKVGAAFPALVPQVDADGIDLGGIRMPEVAVPLATYTGWNLRSPEIGASDQLYSMQGSWIPFPLAQIEKRYPSRQAYLDRVHAAAAKLVTERFLLETDVDKVVERSATEWDYLHRRN
jgi:hypothetical protein